MNETLFELADFEPKPIYSGPAPLHFTTAYFHPDDLAAAHRWLCVQEDMAFGSAVGRIHTWNYGTTTGWIVPEGGATHSLCLMTCCLDCYDYPTHDFERAGEWYPGKRVYTCSCVRVTLHQAICTSCRWHFIDADQQSVIEAWHDHAWPGWRELPTLPAKLRGQMGATKMTPKLEAWFAANYPPEFRVDGAPVITDRGGILGRAVPGYSPFGGFDIAADALT